jgi:hypothetical protein
VERREAEVRKLADAFKLALGEVEISKAVLVEPAKRGSLVREVQGVE